MSERDTRSDGTRRDESSRQHNGTGSTTTASRRRLLHLLGAGSLAGIAGCSGEDGSGTEPDAGTATESEPDAGTTTETEPELRQSVTIGTNNYYFTNYWGLSSMTRAFEPLVGYNHNLEPTPILAESWERIDEDTWEFTLRDGITYHNGDSLNADTVVSRTNQWLSTANWVAQPSGINTTAEGVEKVDEMTFEMTTIQPDAHQYENLLEVKTFGAHPDGPPRSMDSYENLIGTGPFQFEEVEVDQSVTMSAFDEYWGGNPSSAGPHVEELTVRRFEDRNTLALALEGQEIDVAVDLPPSRLDALENSNNAKSASQPMSIVASLHMNLQDGPTSDATLRKALNYAVSQEQIVEATQNGLGVPGRGELPPMYYMSAHDSLPTYGPDKDRARELVEESDYDGETLQYVTQADSPRGASLIAELVQQSFADIGVDVAIQTVGESAAGDRRRNGDGHIFPYTRYLNFLGEFVHTLRQFGSPEGGLEEADNPNNQPRPEVQDRMDPLIETARTASGTEREEAMHDLQHIIVEEALRIPLFHREYLVGMRPGIEGIDWHPVMTSTRTEELKYRQ